MTCKGSSIITVFDNMVQKHRRTLKFKCSNYGKPSQLLDCISNSKEKRIINIVCMPTLHYFLWKQLKQLSLSFFLKCYLYVFALYCRYRGGSGPLQVSRGKTNHPLHKAFIEAGRQAGYPFTDDMNGYQQEGVGWMDMTIYKGSKC